MLGGRLAADADQGYQLSSGGLIVAINGQAIRTQQDFVAAVGRSPETMQFTIRSSQTGRRLNFQTRLRLGPGSRFGVVATEAPLGGVTVVEVREGYPGANVQLIGAEENDLPKVVQFGAQGRFAPLRSEYLDDVARALVVDEVKPHSPAAWAGLKAGDKIVAIGDLHFESDEGFRYAVAYAPFRATVLILDGQTNLPANRTTYIPHNPPDRIETPPPRVSILMLMVDMQ
ncbi:MAG: PDZ domain-containing protein [Thermoguttaceae bacterium]|jgi:S1-C subfamily serine protease